MFRYLYRRAQLKGLLGGSRPWMVVWVVILAARILRRLTKEKPEIVYSEELRPGETLVISSKEREPKVIGA